MTDPVDRPEQVKDPSVSALPRFHPGKVITVEDEPGERPGQVTRLPLARQIGLGEANWPEEHTPAVEVVVEDGEFRLQFLAKPAEEATGSARHRELQLPASGAGKGIEDQLAVKFVGECHGWVQDLPRSGG
jgi:hypothetical protein